jgi:pimeloyl-ACP methyl ester carboxylesterase
LTPTQPSANPTPIKPVALGLLLSDRRNATKIYLARPCQYVNSKICRKYFWTSGRYDPLIIKCYNQVLDKLKIKFNIKEFELIGYSGGAAVSALLAIERTDITKIKSFAGNIDHIQWSNYHKISPLKGSMDPMEKIDKLSLIEQIHYVGADDDNTTPALAKRYCDKMQNPYKCKIKIIPNTDHFGPWEEFWHRTSEAF